MNGLNKLSIRIDEMFVIATIPYIFMGSVFQVIEDANLLKPPVKFFFITPIIFFVIYAIAGVVLSLVGIAILIFNSSFNLNITILTYSLVPAIILTWFISKISPAIGMTYLRNRMYLFAIFSFLLDSFTTYIGVDMFGYTNKHPFSSFLPSVFGTGAVLIPISLILVMVIVFLLEKDSQEDQNKDEKYMMTLTLIVLGFSMGARNLMAMVFGV